MASLVTPSYDRLMDFFTDFRFQSIEAIMMIAFAGSFLTDFDFRPSTESAASLFILISFYNCRLRLEISQQVSSCNLCNWSRSPLLVIMIGCPHVDSIPS